MNRAPLPEFERYGAPLVGISVDGPWCHAADAESRKLRFRALFVLNGDGMVRWSFVSDPAVNPGADGILRALEELNQPGGIHEPA